MEAIFPKELQELGERIKPYENGLQEIRIRINCPVFLAQNGVEKCLEDRYVTSRDITLLFSHLCNHSMYAYEDEIRQGFLTTREGHRIGICGTVVLDEKGRIKTMKYVQAMNIRIAHQVKGVANKVLPFLYQDGQLQNTLILSQPGRGKTTLLRDLIRVISDGNMYDVGRNVSVIDERFELAGSVRGIPQNDLGKRTDLLEGCPKGAGMELLIRSMRPEVLAIDELGNGAELDCLRKACTCGIQVLATAHGKNPEDFFRRFTEYDDMPYLFQRILVLGNDSQHFGLKRGYRIDELDGHWIPM